MSYQEKTSIISIISSLLVFVGLGIYAFQVYNSGNMGSENILSTWGFIFIVLTILSIVSHIILHIIVSTVTAVKTKSKDSFVTDERDKLIELKGTRNKHYVFITGFAISMGMFAMKISPEFIFPALFFFGFLAALVGDISKLYFYRRGM